MHSGTERVPTYGPCCCREHLAAVRKMLKTEGLERCEGLEDGGRGRPTRPRPLWEAESSEDRDAPGSPQQETRAVLTPGFLARRPMSDSRLHSR